MRTPFPFRTVHAGAIALCLVAGCRPEPQGEGSPVEAVAPVKKTEDAKRSTAANGRRASPFRFRTIGAESGLAFERNDDIRGQRRILEANGGGVGLVDFDRDGRLDVFYTNGCALPLSLGDRGSRGEIFRNLGELRFDAVAAASSLVQYGYTHGCAAGDYDSDGFGDLYVTAYGPDTFWRNNGDGTFTDVSAAVGIDAPAWGSSAAFGDLDLDGDLDLYVANYLDESDESPTLCPNLASPDGYSQCSPAVFRGVDDVLYLSDGAGRFADATAAAGIAGSLGKGLGVLIADLGGDPRPEIFVANDGEANFLFVPVSPADGTAAIRYEERGLTSGVALNEAGYAQANMGIAAGDYDANGETDLFITHFFGDTNTLYANRGGLAFGDSTRASELGAASRDRLGWGTVFFDPDDDGRLDLFVANGHVDDRTFMSHGEPYRMRPQVFRNERNGSFSDVSEGAGDYFISEWLGRGVAAGDIDRDGREDLAVSHQLAPSALLRNETPGDGRDEGRVDVYPVTGKLTMSGGPVANASVTFSPKSGQPVATARTDTKGEFALTTYDAGDGAAAGDYVVIVTKDLGSAKPQVSVQHSATGNIKPLQHSGRQPPPAGSSLPERYSSASSTDLNATVKADGENEFSFDLKP